MPRLSKFQKVIQQLSPSLRGDYSAIIIVDREDGKAVYHLILDGDAESNGFSFDRIKKSYFCAAVYKQPHDRATVLKDNYRDNAECSFDEAIHRAQDTVRSIEEEGDPLTLGLNDRYDWAASDSNPNSSRCGRIRLKLHGNVTSKELFSRGEQFRKTDNPSATFLAFEVSGDEVIVRPQSNPKNLLDYPGVCSIMTMHNGVYYQFSVRDLQKYMNAFTLTPDMLGTSNFDPDHAKAPTGRFTS